MTGIRVRQAQAADPDDLAFLRAMAPRLEAGMPARIPAGALAAAVERSVVGALQARRTGEAILLAEDDQGRRLGFIYVVTSQSSLTNEAFGYISEFAVDLRAEGRGVGRALLDAAEAWARSQGLPAMTLKVFCSNARARAVYEHLGYEPDVLELRKLL